MGSILENIIGYWPYNVKFVDIAFTMILCYVCNLNKFVNVKLAWSGVYYCWFAWSVSILAETTVGCEIVKRMLDLTYYVPKTESYIYSLNVFT